MGDLVLNKILAYIPPNYRIVVGRNDFVSRKDFITTKMDTIDLHFPEQVIDWLENEMKRIIYYQKNKLFGWKRDFNPQKEIRNIKFWLDDNCENCEIWLTDNCENCEKDFKFKQFSVNHPKKRKQCKLCQRDLIKPRIAAANKISNGNSVKVCETIITNCYQNDYRLRIQIKKLQSFVKNNNNKKFPIFLMPNEIFAF